MGRKNGNLLNPVVLVARFKIINNTSLALVRTKFHHTIGGTLNKDSVVISITFIVNGSHELVFGGERNFSNNRKLVLHNINITSSKVGSTEDGKLSRVSNLSFTSTIVSKNTLGTKNSWGKSILNKGKVGGSSLGERSIGDSKGGGTFSSIFNLNGVEGGINRVMVTGLHLSPTWGTRVGSVRDDIGELGSGLVLGTLAKVSILTYKVGWYALLGVDVKLVVGVGGNEGSQRHDILGQSSSLIGTDDSDRSKSLYGRKGTDNSIGLGHVSGGPGISKGNDSLKSLGNHGNAAHKSGGNRFEPILLGFKTGNEKGDKSGNSNEQRKKLGYLINLFKYVSLLLLNLGHKLVNSSNLSVISSGDGNSNSRSLGNKSGRESHVTTISKGNLFRVDVGGDLNGSNHLVDGDGFSGKGGFSTGKVGRLDDTHIGGTTVSKSEDDDISWHNFNGGDHDFLAITKDAGIGGKHVLKGLGSLFGGTFLKNSNEGVDGNHGGNKSNLNPGGEDGGAVRIGENHLGNTTSGRYKCNNYKNANQYVGNLFPDLLPDGFLLGLRHLVGTILSKASLRIGSGESCLLEVFICLQGGDCLINREGMPRDDRALFDDFVIRFFSHV
mmetsp:Transcript_2650/g.3686  ORF Transcript_2650/g.3686 Transcript_2650/m.3686 type:complete len:610 (-) Transcript_2650:210-2039(-)